jgi:hypothetical protein
MHDICNNILEEGTAGGVSLDTTVHFLQDKVQSLAKEAPDELVLFPDLIWA